ncbi:hypothetical protein E2C01_063162 [Portunus trituberculatus]|uniref:Uncharacterized protein n=1 Tax=Portunus trituberculatus TaxID=210409 RepID=A0A5B7HGR9_PORTR|nr:hypothetical protein [Portunus trituberculatus]
MHPCHSAPSWQPFFPDPQTRPESATPAGFNECS